MYINEEHLRKLPFIDFLKSIKEGLQGLYHRSKTDVAIYQAETVARLICHRMVVEYKLTWDEYKSDRRTGDFWDDEQILKDYRFTLSDKRKSMIIDKYKNQIEADLQRHIFSYEYNAASHNSA